MRTSLFWLAAVLVALALAGCSGDLSDPLSPEDAVVLLSTDCNPNAKGGPNACPPPEDSDDGDGEGGDDGEDPGDGDGGDEEVPPTCTSLALYSAFWGFQRPRTDGVSTLRIDEVSGALTEVATLGLRNRKPSHVAADPSGRYAYTANAETNTVSSFAIDGCTGELTITGDVAAGDSPRHIDVDPLGRFVYAVNWNSADVSGYRINADGTLTQLSGSPYLSTDDGASRKVAISPQGTHVYVTNMKSASVSVFRIDEDGSESGEAGNLIKIQEAPAGPSARDVALHPSLDFAYVVSASDNLARAYAVDPGTGKLSLLSSHDTGESPRTVAVRPNGDHVFVANPGSNDIYSHRVEGDGTLTHVDVEGVGGFPKTLVIHLSGDWLYSADLDSDSVTQVEVASNGTMTAVGAVFAGGRRPQGLAIAVLPGQ